MVYQDNMFWRLGPLSVECLTIGVLLHYCLFDCPLLENVQNLTYTTIEEALTSLDAAKMFMEMEKVIFVGLILT